MSTFTNDGTFTPCNGPAKTSGVGTPAYPSTKVLLEYIEKYQAVLDSLADKADSSYTGEKDDLSSAALNFLSGTTTTLTAYINEFVTRLSTLGQTVNTKAAAVDLTTLQASVTGIKNTLSTKADASALGAYVKTSALSAYATTGVTDNLQSSLTSLSEALASLQDALTKVTKVYAETENGDAQITAPLYATETHTELKATKTIDFTDMPSFEAYYLGTGSQTDTGTYGMYIVGMLAEDWQDTSVYENKSAEGKAIFQKYTPKPGTLLLKYVGTHCLDAVINATAAYEANSESVYTGKLSATVTHDWPDAKLHLVYAADTNGNNHIYIGVSSTAFATSSSEYPVNSFYASGINVYPTGHDKFVYPNVLTTSLDYIEASEPGLVGKMNPDNVLTEEELDEMWTKVVIGEFTTDNLVVVSEEEVEELWEDTQVTGTESIESEEA